MSLKTNIGNILLSSPLLLASGYITETPDFFLKAKKWGCAGMVTRSLKEIVPAERRKVPAPRYVVDGHKMMLNCEWGNEHPWKKWHDGWADQVKESDSPIIISLSGRNIESCTKLIQSFDKIGVDGFEINVSCSHSGSLHGNLNIDFQHLDSVLTAIRPITQSPIWIKLSYSNIVVEMAKRAETLGADAIVCTNTIGPGLLIDTETGKPKLGIKNGAGGLSGKAIFPIALRCIYEISKAVQIPVVGVGGICSSDDVIQMLMAGANAVQLYTFPALRGPRIFKAISIGLLNFLKKHPEYQNITNLIGKSHQWRQNHQFEVSSKPKINTDKCNGCKICIKSCAFEALSFSKQSKTAIIGDNCIACNACSGVCPKQAIQPAT
jgi:dihydroorotate dehydrogenase subfamily 1